MIFAGCFNLIQLRVEIPLNRIHLLALIPHLLKLGDAVAVVHSYLKHAVVTLKDLLI